MLVTVSYIFVYRYLFLKVTVICLSLQYMKGLRNFEMAQPTTHAEYRLGLIVKEGGWTVNEMLECADEMTVENITSYIPQLLSR